MDGPLVLVVDDSSSDRELTLRFFRQHAPDAQFRTYSDGQLALDALTEIAQDNTAELPALVLLDQRMPRLNGDEVLVRTRSLPRLVGVPFIVFSSSALEEDALACLASGGCSFVRKPLEFEDYNRAIELIATYWLTLNTNPAKSNRSIMLR